MKVLKLFAVIAVACLAACAAPVQKPGEQVALLQQLSDVRVQLAALNEKFADLDQRLPPKPLPKKADIPFAGNPVLGERGAKIGIVEFSDYQCPYCRSFHVNTFPDLKKDYIDTGKVVFVSRNSPMDFHPNAEPAAVAAQCAGEQSAYFEMQSDLYNHQMELSTALYQKLAEQLKLNPEKFSNCLSDPRKEQHVHDDLDYSLKLGVQGTPTFFIGRVDGDRLVNAVPVVGAQPYAAFAQMLDGLLGKN